MSEISAKIINARITKTHFEIDPNLNGTFQIKSDGRIELGEPIEDSDKTAVLKFLISFSIPDCDKLLITVDGEYICEFSEIPKDYSEVGEKLCVPLARKEITKFINSTLENMGFPPLISDDSKNH